MLWLNFFSQVYNTKFGLFKLQAPGNPDVNMLHDGSSIVTDPYE